MRWSFENLTVDEPVDHILRITFNRPQSANAFNTAMALELRDLVRDLYHDPGDYRIAILTGAGDKVFCAGADLKERDGMTDGDWQRQHALFEQIVRGMWDCPVPIIAAVNGPAYAGGLELALCCDFIYAAPNARFAFTEVSLGIMPGAGGTQTLARAIGTRRAKEIILSATPFDAEQALAWGLVNRITAEGALMDEVLATARKIAANAPLAVRQAKKSVGIAGETDISSGYAFELEAYNRLVTTEDRIEGIRAFGEKRKPKFTGR